MNAKKNLEENLDEQVKQFITKAKGLMAELDQNNADLRDLLKKWGMNQTILAERAEMSKQAFTNALNGNATHPNKPAKFKTQHLDNLYWTLTEMRNDIDKYLQSYWDGVKEKP